MTSTSAAVFDPRAVIREALDRAMRSAQVNLPSVTREVVEDLKRTHGAALDAYMDQILYAWTYEEAQRALGASRVVDALSQTVPVRLSTTRTMTADFTRWFEHAGDRHISLPQMLRPTLLIAAGERRERARHELTIALFLASLAAELPDDTTTVGSVFDGKTLAERFGQAGNVAERRTRA